MDIEADDISFTIFDLDVITLPNVVSTFVLAGVFASTDIVFLMSDSANGHFFAVVFPIPCIVRLCDSNRVEDNIVSKFAFVNFL